MFLGIQIWYDHLFVYSFESNMFEMFLHVYHHHHSIVMKVMLDIEVLMLSEAEIECGLCFEQQ